MLAGDSLHVRQYRPHSAMLPHIHCDATLSVVVGGDYVERIGRTERRYAMGHVAFCPAGVPHAQEFGSAGARQIVLEPQQDWLGQLAGHVDLDQAPYSSSGELRRLGIRLLHELANEDEFSGIAREGIVLEVLAAFARIADAPTPKPPAWLAAARDFIHAHAHSPLSMARIAHAVGRHEMHLSREFRRHYGASIGNYLRRLRVEEAARLLAQSREDITGIALRCGFANHSHLCRIFRTQYGLTPSEYRTRHRR